MDVSVIKRRQWLKTLKSLGYYALVLGVILSVLYVLKSLILQIIGFLLIVAFIVIGFYFLGYLLFGIISLIIIVASVICALSILVYFLV